MESSDIASDLAAAFDGSQNDVVEEVKTEEIPEAIKEDRTRDETGRFAAKAETQPETAAAETPTEPVAPVVDELKMPSSWKKEYAEKWSALPPEMKGEVLRRESDMHKGIEGYKQDAQFGQSMKSAITPYMATLNSLGVSPDKAISELMAADHKLRYGSPHEKHAYFAQLAQTYGIDLGQMPEQAQIDPYLQQLQNEIQGLKQTQNQMFASKQQQEDQELNSRIDSFKSEPGHEHFNEVAAEMAALIQAGVVSTLQDAYDRAIYANPNTRSQLEAKQRQENEKKALETAAAKAAAAKRAGFDVKGQGGMGVASAEHDTVRDSLMAAFGGG